MLHSLSARVLLMATETGEDIVECPLILTECINYVLRKMPAALRTTLAFNIQIEVMSVMYDAVHIDFSQDKDFPSAPEDNRGAHFGL